MALTKATLPYLAQTKGLLFSKFSIFKIPYLGIDLPEAQNGSQQRRPSTKRSSSRQKPGTLKVPSA